MVSASDLAALLRSARRAGDEDLAAAVAARLAACDSSPATEHVLARLLSELGLEPPGD
jgi:hypothetical protein